MGMSMDRPRILVVAESMRQIQYRHWFGCLLVIGRRINSQPAPLIDGIGIVVMQVHGAVRDVLQIPVSWRIRVYMQDAGLGPTLWLDVRIARINSANFILCAFGAVMRKVTRPSERISGDFWANIGEASIGIRDIIKRRCIIRCFINLPSQ